MNRDCKTNQEDNFNVHFEEEKVKKLLGNDVTPQIEMAPERYQITIYTFYAMTGIYKTTWAIDSKPPYRMHKIQEEKVVENNIRGFY